MPKIIGLTGGIGSGKTTIAKHFEKLGIPVYIADLEAKKILDKKEVIDEIVDIFGSDVETDGKVDKKKLAAIVFDQPEKLQILNNIIHPEVAKHFKNWVKSKKDFDLIIKEAAILFESGSYKDCDQIILVTAPKETRIQRVMKRDNILRESIESRMANQWSEEKKKSLSNFIINNEDLSLAIKDAENIISILRNR